MLSTRARVRTRGEGGEGALHLYHLVMNRVTECYVPPSAHQMAG